jgi:hypothetical protein
VQEYLGSLEHDDEIHCSTMEWYMSMIGIMVE